MHCSMYMGEAPSEAVWSGAFTVPYRVVLMSSGRWAIGAAVLCLGQSGGTAVTAQQVPPPCRRVLSLDKQPTTPSMRPSHFCCSLAGMDRVHD
jgi:hypothetical protein